MDKLRSSRRTTLVTGVSGLVGRAVAKYLQSRVVGLAHTDLDVPEADEILEADVCQPWLGLSRETWHELADRVDTVVHSAAVTTWGQPRSMYEEVNIGGTGRILDFARAAGASVHMISSCFVHAIERGNLEGLRPGNVVTPYIWSKLEAERLVVESGLPYTIHRPTNVIGDSQTGASSRPQIVQQLSEWFCRGKVPFFPLHQGNLVDFIPLDVVGTAVARAVERDVMGETIWQTYGPEAMSADDVQQIIVDHATALGRCVEPVPVADPTRPFPVPLNQISLMSRRFLQVLIDTSEITYACGGILPTSLPDLRRNLGVPTVSDRDAYRRTLMHWDQDRVMVQSD